MRKRREKGNRLKHRDTVIEQYNLIRNRNGFEESIEIGTRQDLERLRLELESKERLEQGDESKQAWERVSYYVVPKREWDLEHCPLMPVDYS